MYTPPPPEGDIVYVPVPSQWLGSVYSLLGTLGGRASVPGTTVEAGESQGEQLVHRMYLESEGEQRRLMRLLAERPDEWRYSKELAEELELPHGARGLAGMFGAFGRRAKHRYEGQKPWESRWDGAREENRYRMPPDIAAMILDVANSES
jgi:hypothetical protein